MGGRATYIDAEHSLDPVWAKKLGVNLDHMLLSQPNSGEEALEIADVLIQDGNMDVIVVDSVAALVPKSELEGQVGDFVIGAQARLMSGVKFQLFHVISFYNVLFYFIFISISFHFLPFLY